MIKNIIRKIFGSANERFIRSLQKDVVTINEMESLIKKMSDDELRIQTSRFKERLEMGESLDELLPEAFATVREAAWRTLGQRHYDVQLLGGIVLHKGMISEMRTGEGKTLVGTLAVYLNALAGKGVHVVTVNDYLAKRDAEWMGEIYRFLGLSVGCIVHGLTDQQRQDAYMSDITYGTNNEFGFDLLRDNMKFSLNEKVQRPFYFALVDEVDSILIDEARTPLIISGPAEDSTDLYTKVNGIIPLLHAEDYEKDEKHRSITLTETGTDRIEQLLSDVGLLTTGALYDVQNISLVHHVNQALKAHKIFARDVDYIVKDYRVMIVDEFTGRMMEGRRYSEGLHQALEAKENVDVQMENQTLASITYQNYFRLYPKLAGMTGSGMTEAQEFEDIYKLRVVEIPTHIPPKRLDHDDEIYRTNVEKTRAIIKLIEECFERKQPILVGTISIEKSESLAAELKKHNIPHQVLNARYHEQEAEIIAQAGRPGSITIATNMAGRGTDIQLGGNIDMMLKQEVTPNMTFEEIEKIEKRLRIDISRDKEIVRNAGGLYVIGTERHESRRIDNQLRGRSGRQGDPGASKFFLALEDDLMRIFGSERMDNMLVKLGLKEDEAIFHPWINTAIERAQKKVEARNYEMRKHIVKYDDVMNDQRKVIYEMRMDLMTADEIRETITQIRESVIARLVDRCIPADTYSDQWDINNLHEEVLRVLGADIPVHAWCNEEGIGPYELKSKLFDALERHMIEKEDAFGEEFMIEAEKNLYLKILDQMWKEHLLSLDHLRQGINLRAYAQKDPLNEYKREAFLLFQDMMESLEEAVVAYLAHMHVPTRPVFQERRGPSITSTDTPTVTPVSRNADCPCGSGLRYKHCHGKI